MSTKPEHISTIIPRVLEDLKANCKHEYGHYRPNMEPGPILVCSGCGIELDVLTQKPIEAKL